MLPALWQMNNKCFLYIVKCSCSPRILWHFYDSLVISVNHTNANNDVPLVLSPNSCMWKPCFPGASPVIFPQITISESGFYTEHTHPRKTNNIDIRKMNGYSVSLVLHLGRVANPRPVAKIKTGRVSQPITDAAHATGRAGLGLQCNPEHRQIISLSQTFELDSRYTTSPWDMQTVTIPPQADTALRLVLNYTSWWQRHSCPDLFVTYGDDTRDFCCTTWLCNKSCNKSCMCHTLLQCRVLQQIAQKKYMIRPALLLCNFLRKCRMLIGHFLHLIICFCQ